MAVFKCKMCGGALDIFDESVMYCRYCGTKQTLPKLPSERKEALYDRAGMLRLNHEYDKAMAVYEQILSEDPEDAETYWSLVLCRYGIEYVEDPVTERRVPTVNRAQFTSVFDDANYKEAIAHADPVQRLVYEQEAKTINEIQKGILQISEQEEPFDVFICYKETDENGRRTPDSVLANELYHQLTQEGFKVFFARITLEDKLGSAYEPYIFAALNSAKVMVVIGTKAEYIQAPWVENEWSRFLAMIKAGEKKVLIPAYKDMDPYDLPEAFSHLQAQDMTRLGFMQDLIRGIKKIVGADQKTNNPKNDSDNTTSPLLKRVFMFLEDGDFESADEYCERVLDIDPECSKAYIGKLMVKYQCHTAEDLLSVGQDFSTTGHYKRILKYGTSDEIAFIQRAVQAAADAAQTVADPKTEKQIPQSSPVSASKTPIEELSLSVLAYNHLKRCGIHTIEDLTAHTEEELAVKASLSEKVLEEIRSILLSRMLSLHSVASKTESIPQPNQEDVKMGLVEFVVNKNSGFFSVNNESPYRFVVDESAEYVVLAEASTVSRYYKLPVGKHTLRLFVEDKGLPSNNKQTDVIRFEVFEDRVTTIRGSRPGVISNVTVQIVFKPLPILPIKIEKSPTPTNQNKSEGNELHGTVKMVVKKAAGLGLMAYADGSVYKFVFDKTKEKIVISGKKDVTETIQLPYGSHTVQVYIHSYNDPKCQKGSTTKSAERTFTVSEKSVTISADRPSAFSSTCSLSVN